MYDSHTNQITMSRNHFAVIVDEREKVGFFWFVSLFLVVVVQKATSEIEIATNTTRTSLTVSPTRVRHQSSVEFVHACRYPSQVAANPKLRTAAQELAVERDGSLHVLPRARRARRGDLQLD